MQRPSEREFLIEVLRDMEGLPEGLPARMSELLEATAEDRVRAIRELIEELAGE